MPTRRTRPIDRSPGLPGLRKSREEAARLLQVQVDAGAALVGRIGPRNYTPEIVDAIANEAERWSSHNVTLLRSMFDNDEVATNYGWSSAIAIGTIYDDFRETLSRLRQTVTDRVSFLQGLVETLYLYDAISDRPSIAPAAVGAPTHQRPQIAFHNYGTVGTLNTGEVLGSIHSHASAVTGSSSADAFREAVNALAAAIAQDRELLENRRKEALESIEALVEEASRQPENRRIGVLRGMLLAIPVAISLSGRALGSWDKYGAPIRAHLGL